MSDTTNPGPTHETLANLHAMLPSFIKGLEKKKTLGRGTALRPRKVCKVCGLLFDKVSMSVYADQEIKGDLCEKCGPALQEGCIAIVCGDKWSIIKDPDPSMADLAGQIVHVKPNTMEAYEHKFNGATVHIKRRDPAGEA